MNRPYDWTIDELQELYHLPLLELISKANAKHVKMHEPSEIQVCSLISIKTGGCPEDCRYCAQSSRYQTPVSAQAMMTVTEVLQEAQKAVDKGATRICLGAAWKEIRDTKQFEDVLQMVTQINRWGVEVCCTLGRLKDYQAARLKEAGLYAYNHNLDSSEQFYPTIITSRTYEERLATLDIVEKATLSLCCGGILGMGESTLDRLQLLLTLCHRHPQPESVPINRLSPIPGTPLAGQPKISVWDMVRLIAVARLIMPHAMIRLSAGRIDMSFEEQTLCFLAGANSIFAGDKLLTVANTPVERDAEMFQLLGLRKRPAFTKAF